ncbi:MAG: FAD-binding protein [Candidatus Saccharimonadales bacterium]
MEPVSRSLAPYTSLRVGGDAERLAVVEKREDVIELLSKLSENDPVWFLGYGTNTLVSDRGLPGTTVVWRGGEIWQDETEIVVDAGVWWDDVVQYSIEQGLWGFELMSEIPSSVGGAVFGNIAAYGQQISDTLLWVEVFDRKTGQTSRLDASAIDFAYRESSLQTQAHRVILQAAFKLSKTPLHTLKYDSALRIAHELGASVDTLEGVRRAIVETRSRAGSIYHPDNPHAEHTAGSFFKNPLVTPEQAMQLAKFDESGKTLERVAEQNRIHGGSDRRASAAHVLLAAGFSRGQTWDKVRLHPQHVLKLETLEGATSAEVYAVAQEIIQTVKSKLDITITPEARFLGTF